MKFRVATTTAVVAVLTAAMAGCSGGSSGEETTPDKLTILISNSPSAGALQSTAPLFTEETGIEIEFVDVPYDQLSTKLVLAGQSGTATFDIAQYDQPVLASVVPSNGLAPLDDFLSADGDFDWDDFPEPLHEYAAFEGVTYGVPLSTEPYVQMYRTDLYDQAGLTPATSWDELNANVQAVTALGDDTYGYAGPYGASASAEQYLERLYGYGGRLLDPDTGEPLLDSDIAAEAMTDFVELADDAPEATLAGSSIDSAIQFTQLPVGLNVNPSGWYPTLNDPDQSGAAGLLGVAPVPLEQRGEFDPKNILKGWLIGVSEQSSHQQAAWDFISFALGADNVQTFIDGGATVPGRTSTLESAEYQEQLPYLQYVQPGIENGSALPSIPEMPPISVAISETVNALAVQGGNVDAAMQSLNAEVREILVNGGRLDP